MITNSSFTKKNIQKAIDNEDIQQLKTFRKIVSGIAQEGNLEWLQKHRKNIDFVASGLQLANPQQMYKRYYKKAIIADNQAEVAKDNILHYLALSKEQREHFSNNLSTSNLESLLKQIGRTLSKSVDDRLAESLNKAKQDFKTFTAKENAKQEYKNKQQERKEKQKQEDAKRKKEDEQNKKKESEAEKSSKRARRTALGLARRTGTLMNQYGNWLWYSSLHNEASSNIGTLARTALSPYTTASQTAQGQIGWEQMKTQFAATGFLNPMARRFGLTGQETPEEATEIVASQLNPMARDYYLSQLGLLDVYRAKHKPTGGTQDVLDNVVGVGQTVTSHFGDIAGALMLGGLGLKGLKNLFSFSSPNINMPSVSGLGKIGTKALGHIGNVAYTGYNAYKHFQEGATNKAIWDVVNGATIGLGTTMLGTGLGTPVGLALMAAGTYGVDNIVDKVMGDGNGGIRSGAYATADNPVERVIRVEISTNDQVFADEVKRIALGVYEEQNRANAIG